MRWVMWALVASVTAGALTGTAWAQPKEVDDKGTGPWPVDVPNFVPVQPGEHPRLLFRKGDLEKLRAKAKTPEGQQAIARLRKQLNGKDGETMPPHFGTPAGKGEDEVGGGLDYYTFSHAAGFGMLYQLTGDKKYAELGKQCMDKALVEGVKDRDPRYSYRKPSGALRSGPVLGWTALGYDLCYDGWEPAYREKVAKELATYKEAQWMSLPELTRGDRQHPGSNHWGMQVGGAALCLLAIMKDPGVDMAQIEPLLAASQKSMLVNMTQGFGSGAFYVEGDGTGSMSSHISFLSALQAWRIAAGKDFYAPRPNAQWMVHKWFFLTALGGDPMHLRASFPERGEYPHNIWGRGGISGGCYFGIGFGVATEEQKAGILWYYDHCGMKDADLKGGYGLDAPSPYPHHSVVAFVNWPLGMAEKNPGDVLPHAYADNKNPFFAWRNRWQDKDDIIISILTHAVRGNYGSKGENTLTIQHGGKTSKWGNIQNDFKGEFRPAADGSTVLVTGDGSSLAIDFSKASGADAMLVLTGPGAPAGKVLQAGAAKFSFLFLGGAAAEPKVEGEKVVVGKQTVSFDGKQIVLGVFGPPAK